MSVPARPRRAVLGELASARSGVSRGSSPGMKP